ncbi:MAG TPA: hypothetical protein VHZ98_16290 [Galbitalea sp.]|jgi:hypothetical protein|nr:hypothetical protein [Galbitalea sp.]
MTSRLDARWSDWASYFDDVEQDMATLFHTRWMWKTITGILDNSGIKQYVVVQNYLVRTYAATMCTGIRRESDIDTKTTSLARCLQILIDSPKVFTRRRFDQLLRQGGNTDWYNDFGSGGFDVFASKDGELLDPGKVQASLDRLHAAVEPVRRYTNEVVAHRQRADGAIEPVVVTYDEIDHALDELGVITKQYYSLRHPDAQLAFLTPIVDLGFLNMFQVPWFPAGSTLADNRRDHL